MTTHEKRDLLLPHLVILCNKPCKLLEKLINGENLVLLNYLPCGEVCAQSFAQENRLLFSAVSCSWLPFNAYNMEVWSCDINCCYGNGNCSFTNTHTTVPLKSVIKQSFCLEHVSLFRMALKSALRNGRC